MGRFTLSRWLHNTPASCDRLDFVWTARLLGKGCVQALVERAHDLLHVEVALVSPKGEAMAALTMSLVAALALRNIARECGIIPA